MKQMFEMEIDIKEYKKWCEKTHKKVEDKMSKIEYMAYLGNKDAIKLMNDIYSGDVDIDSVQEGGKEEYEQFKKENTENMIKGFKGFIINIYKMVGCPDEDTAQINKLLNEADPEFIDMLRCKTIGTFKDALIKIQGCVFGCLKIKKVEEVAEKVCEDLKKKEKKEAN